MNFEVGKLYRCSSHYLLVCPTDITAHGRTAATARDQPRTWAEDTANYWSERLSRKVNFSLPNEPFLVLKIGTIKNKYNDIFLNVLFGDKIGWILYNEIWDWIKIERIY